MKLGARQNEQVRGYRQTARAEATVEREERILTVFTDLLRARWLDEITLNDVAAGAGVTVQTVIRKFGGKEGLLTAVAMRLGREIKARLTVPDGAVDAAIAALVDDYDKTGDLVMRCLAQEERVPALEPFLTLGRTQHRAWVAQVFRPWLKGLGPKARRERSDLLVAATDLYVWRLFRRDMGHDAATTVALTRALVRGLIGPSTDDNVNRVAEGGSQ